MVNLLVKLILALIVAFAASMVNKSAFFPVAIVAIITVAADWLFDKISKFYSDPQVEVSVLSSKDNTLGISIKSRKPVLLLNIDLSILGEVILVNDFIEQSDAKSVRLNNFKSRFITHGIESKQSYIQIQIENMIDNKELRFSLKVNPMHSDILNLPATENYKVFYQWSLNGNLQAKVQWFSVKSGKKIKEPNVRMGSYKEYNG